MSSAALQAMRVAKYKRRARTNVIALILSLGAMAFGLVWLIWILVETVRLGLGGMALATFTEMTPPPQEAGGLANALVGSLMMVGLATLIGTPIGVMAGVYLAEYGQRGWLGSVTRFINDILLSAPSIVIGLFIYAVVVARMKTFSGWAGVLALALIVIPVVIRTTENMLVLVPNALREAAYALGAPRWSRNRPCASACDGRRRRSSHRARRTPRKPARPLPSPAAWPDARTGRVLRARLPPHRTVS